MFNLELWPWPWPDLVKYMHYILAYLNYHWCRVILKSYKVFKIYRADTKKTVIHRLILNYDLDLKPTLIKHAHWTPPHHTWHLWVIWKSHKGLERYWADTQAWRTDRQTDRQTDWRTDGYLFIKAVWVGGRQGRWKYPQQLAPKCDWFDKHSGWGDARRWPCCKNQLDWNSGMNSDSS